MRVKNAAFPPSRTLFALGLLGALPAASSLRADLESYLKAPDESFEWRIEEEVSLPGIGTALNVRLTSQTWHGIAWKHWLSLIRPAEIKHPEHALLVISGGSNGSKAPKLASGTSLMLAQIARNTGVPVAILSQVPNQPLFGDLREDALIAHTFQQFLEAKDETWPCLLPMTKSAVRAMDVIAAVAKEKYSQEIKRFFVTGASKRGWTTWLTAAVDPRVFAIAPMVIDTLNMAKQMPLQLLSFGTYSEQIRDYTELNLPSRMAEPAARRLIEIVDPYSYRQKLTLPKLIILGTNDRYWPVDAVKLYFPDLQGEKYIHYAPNEGHGLGAGMVGAVQAITAFYSSLLEGKARPRFSWKLEADSKECRLVITAQDPPEQVELWQASAPTRDFREARWAPAPSVSRDPNGRFVGTVPVPEAGFAALFGRLIYKSSLGHDYALSTNIEVLGDKSTASPEAAGK